MQLWPAVRNGYSEEGEDPENNPLDNVKAGTRYLKHILDKYNKYFKDLDTMKWIYGVYNLGETRFNKFKKKYGRDIEKYEYNGSVDKMKDWGDAYNEYKKKYNSR